MATIKIYTWLDILLVAEMY